MSTDSFIARPTATGYEGVFVHMDGFPSAMLPLLLAARRYRFAGDLDALARHLLDDVTFGWSYLGDDLLDGAPEDLRADLIGAGPYPSRQIDSVVDGDGTPVSQKLTVTEHTRDDLEWGYVLHPVGIEVIYLLHHRRGRLVSWGTDPRAQFDDAPSAWAPPSPIEATARQGATAPTAHGAPTSPGHDAGRSAISR